jgi:hypothetical protein
MLFLLAYFLLTPPSTPKQKETTFTKVRKIFATASWPISYLFCVTDITTEAKIALVNYYELYRNNQSFIELCEFIKLELFNTYLFDASELVTKYRCLHDKKLNRYVVTAATIDILENLFIDQFNPIWIPIPRLDGTTYFLKLMRENNEITQNKNSLKRIMCKYITIPLSD